ncbi:hypothetical protein HDU76_010404, partial [Blyttiomyces sp. JEL0837]
NLPDFAKYDLIGGQYVDFDQGVNVKVPIVFLESYCDAIGFDASVSLDLTGRVGVEGKVGMFYGGSSGIVPLVAMIGVARAYGSVTLTLNAQAHLDFSQQASLLGGPVNVYGVKVAGLINFGVNVDVIGWYLSLLIFAGYTPKVLIPNNCSSTDCKSCYPPYTSDTANDVELDSSLTYGGLITLTLTPKVSFAAT